jgi:hypothetical protein
MDTDARRALNLIRRCVAADRFTMLPHFRQRMAERGLVWPDILAVLDEPEGVRSGGHDRWERPKWLISGTAADELPIEVVCVLDEDRRGDATVFITIYAR